MALKIVDGFDNYNGINDLLARSGFLQWQVVTPQTPAVSFVTGASGNGKALRLTDNNGASSPNCGLRGVFSARNAEFYEGVRLRIPSGLLGSATQLQVVLTDTVSGSAQLTFYFNVANYSVSVYRGTTGGTLLVASANNVWIGDTFSFVEVYAKIDGSTGAFDVRVRGNSVFGGTQTGKNTQASANAWADAIDFNFYPLNINNVAFIDLDDYRYNDTTSDAGASPNNSFMGDLGIYSKFATGDGTTVQWTPDTGTFHFSRVNEQAMDGDGSYNFSSTPGQEDQLTFQPLTQVVPIIYGVFVTIAVRKDDVGPRVVKVGLKSGATVSYGTNHSVPDTYAYFTDAYIVDPNTGTNWTRTGFNNVLGLYNLVS